MRPINRFCLPALATLIGLASSARAQVAIQVPFVTIQTGSGGVYVRAPFVTVQVPRKVVGAPVAPPIEVAPTPDRIGDPIPVPIPKPGQNDFSVPVPLTRPVKPMTHREFAETFKPSPGTYDVVLLHPATNKPVQVTFTLPQGSARKVRIFPRQINFDYDRGRDVTIRFMADGRVRVTN